MTVRELPEKLRPREKARQQGIESLSDSELLAILLRCGYKGTSSIKMAEEILREAGGFSGLLRRSLEEIMNLKGIKLAKAVELMAAMEIARRMSWEKVYEEDAITSPESIVRWLKMRYGLAEQELFIVIFLDVRNKVKGHAELFRGAVDNVHVEAREIFKQALRVNARKIIISHNHPSGNCRPSSADEEVTEVLCRAGEFMNIPVLDHIIISSNDYFSFKEQGRL